MPCRSCPTLPAAEGLDARLVAEAGDMRRFRTPDAFAASVAIGTAQLLIAVAAAIKVI